MIKNPNDENKKYQQVVSLDEEVHEAANNNELGFTIYSYSTDKRKGTFYSIKWVDIEKG